MGDPHWEHGYRCHGYWLGVVRWGYVSIQAHRFGRVPAAGGYKWEFTREGVTPNDPADQTAGYADTLRAAKRAVEQAYRAWLGTHTPVRRSRNGTKERSQ